jgi:ESAT-6 family protein
MLEPTRLFDGPMRYEFGQLMQGADDINVAMKTMNDKLTALDASIRPKLADWDGNAYGNYDQLKANWDTSARNIENLLNSIARAVMDSSERMAAQEMQNASRFVR